MQVVTLSGAEYWWARFLRGDDPLPLGATCFKVTRHGALVAGPASYAATIDELAAAGVDLADLNPNP